MKKLKLLYVITQGQWGGAQKYVFDLATSLYSDFDITVAVGDQNSTPDLQQKILNKNIKLVQLEHLVRPISPIHDLLAIFELKTLYKKIKPDIIHLNSSKAGILGSLATYNLKPITYKLIYTVHGWVFNEPMSVWKKRLYVWLEKTTSKIKNNIIVLSEKEKKTATDLLSIPEDKLSVIPIGIDIFKDTLTKQDVRNKLKKYVPNIPNNEWHNSYIIGTIANLYASKNLDSLIKAIAKTSKTISNFRLIIIGEGEERKKLEKIIAENNLKNIVYLPGFLYNASQYLPAFDLFVLSSKKEGLPYSILEANAQNIPVIATDVGSVSDIIKNQKTGLLVPSENTDKLSEAIVYAYNNPDIMKKISQTAQDEVSRFSKENTVNKTTSLYLKQSQSA